MQFDQRVWIPPRKPWTTNLPQNEKSHEAQTGASGIAEIAVVNLLRGLRTKNRVEEDAEQVADVVVSDGRVIDEVLEQQAI